MANPMDDTQEHTTAETPDSGSAVPPVSSPDDAGPPAGATDAPAPGTAAAGPAMAAAWLAYLAVAVACIAYVVFAASRISDAYVDFGDGNYLYIASRLNEGALPYRDIMAPQPPMHLLVGSWALKLGRIVGAEIAVVRCVSMLLHLGIVLMVVSIARAVGQSWFGAAAAGCIYAVLPTGVLWSLGYQSEPLEILFLAICVRLILPLRAAPALAASVFGALAVFTNMTAVPYVGLIGLWLLYRQWRAALAFILPLAALCAAGVWWMEVWTGAYLQNVFFNQVGTYPKDDLLPYAWRKLSSEGGDILIQQGFACLLALLGAALLLRERLEPRAEFLGMFGLASIASIVFVTKGGTAEYIFTIGEPYVAVFAGYTLNWMIRAARGRDTAQRTPWLSFAGALAAASLATAAALLCAMLWQIGHLTSLGAPPIYIQVFSAGVLIIALTGALFFMIGKSRSPDNSAPVRPRIFHRALCILLLPAALAAFSLQSGLALRVFRPQLSAPEVRQIIAVIRDHSRHGDPILAHPYFAFRTQRLVAAEHAEVLIWTIGYHTEQKFRYNPNPSPVDGPSTRQILKLAEMLEDQSIPLVILDMKQMGFSPDGQALIPVIMNTLERKYRPLTQQDIAPPTLDTPFRIFIPRQPGEPATPLAWSIDQLYPPESASAPGDPIGSDGSAGSDRSDGSDRTGAIFDPRLGDE